MAIENVLIVVKSPLLIGEFLVGGVIPLSVSLPSLFHLPNFHAGGCHMPLGPQQNAEIHPSKERNTAASNKKKLSWSNPVTLTLLIFHTFPWRFPPRGRGASERAKASAALSCKVSLAKMRATLVRSSTSHWEIMLPSGGKKVCEVENHHF